MANAKLQLISGGNTKTYVIEGLLNMNVRKSQQTPPLPIPLQTDENAVLSTIMGQTRTITCDFIIVQRDDDYTDGTGTPVSNPRTIYEQRVYLIDTIFGTNGKHRLIDQFGDVFEGRIQDMDFVAKGDDPNSDSCVFTFVRGIAL